MITRDEIDERSAALGIHTSSVQRDYVFGWLLASLYGDSALARTLVLKGGNVLRKAYLPDARFSDDLDFTTPNGLSPDFLVEEFNKVCAAASSRSGVSFDLDRNRVVEHRLIDERREVHKLKFYFKDFSGNAAHITLSVRVDVTEYDRLHLPVQQRAIIHPYSDADNCVAELQCVKLEEALADKLKCLLQRRYCNDLFDLVYAAFIADNLGVDRLELIRVFLSKTIFAPSPVAAKRLILGLPFNLFRAFWDKVACPLAARMSFDGAIQTLHEGIDALFLPFGYGEAMAAAFYPSDLRNLILQAGSEQRLLAVTYQGRPRIAEPYSLKFKHLRNGLGQEYLYVYDRTGGRSDPGIKSWLHGNIQSLELTDETFTPRVEIELAKAGEHPQLGFFPGNPGPRTRRAVAGPGGRRLARRGARRR